MNELSHSIVTKARELNRLSEFSQVALGMCLVKIKEEGLYKGEYESFDEFYRLDLKRSKGDVSKLMKVGKYILDAGFHEETTPQLPYTVAYAAINAFPDDDPKLVISRAQTLSLSEINDEAREKKHGPHNCEAGDEYWVKCKVCERFMRV